MKIDELSSSRFLSNEKLQQFSLSRAKVAVIVAICAIVLIGYYFLRPAKPVNRTFPPVPGSAPRICQIQVHIDTSKIKTTPVELNSTILRIVKNNEEASYPLADLKLTIFRYIINQREFFCIRRDRTEDPGPEIHAIKYSQPFLKGRIEGYLFNRDSDIPSGELIKNVKKIDDIEITVIKRDGTTTRHTFTTQSQHQVNPVLAE